MLLKVRSPCHVKWLHLRKRLNARHSYTDWTIALNFSAIDMRIFLESRERISEFLYRWSRVVSCANSKMWCHVFFLLTCPLKCVRTKYRLDLIKNIFLFQYIFLSNMSKAYYYFLIITIRVQHYNHPHTRPSRARVNMYVNCELNALNAVQFEDWCVGSVLKFSGWAPCHVPIDGIARR